MKILGIKTDTPVLELRLKVGNQGTVDFSEEIGRDLSRRLLTTLETFLANNHESFDTIDGIVCYAGPGSFTGLRIGHTVMNTLAYGRGIPITQSSCPGWFEDGVQALLGGVDDKLVIPQYGSEPNITQPKK